MTALPSRIPRATYRVQLHSGFTFEHLRALVPYLSELGISEVYCAPFYKAVPGSTHGYDVSDQNQINDELGGREGLDRLSGSLREKGLGLITDFVPNHMGIVGPYNWRWLDVLENGVDSPYARYFDIEWKPRIEPLRQKVMVPMLGDHYGKILESGQLQVRCDEGKLWLYAPGSRFPLCPESYRFILSRLLPALDVGQGLETEAQGLVQELTQLVKREGTLEERQANAVILSAKLRTFFAQPDLKTRVDAMLVTLNGSVGLPESFDSLHELIELQHYRLTFWKAGAHEVNYRRFFAIDTLIGLRMEDPDIFAETHQLLAELAEKQVITGVRLDHIDGLWNPEEYLRRLAGLLSKKDIPLYTLVEKILAPKENLPGSWIVHGTSGYEFAGNLIELFLRPDDQQKWSKIYADFTGVEEDSVDLTYRAKCFVLDEIFPNAISNLALELDQLIEGDRRWRDLTVHDLEVALAQIIACLPVYRTYKMGQQYMAPEQSVFLKQALSDALGRNRFLDPVPFQFVADVMQGTYPPSSTADERRSRFDGWICKFQQATGAVMAKSVEDTLFYRYTRMFATNEVGHHPSRFGATPQSFHYACGQRLNTFPLNMLATSTHDTKMSEDVRARLFALAEMPQEWCENLQEWHLLNEVCKTDLGGLRAPDSNEEYLLYQILLGSWPLDMEVVNDEYANRIKAYFRKAVEEAKINTNWIHPNQAWLQACDRFVDGILGRGAPTVFVQSFLGMATKIAQRGMMFSLAQTVLKLTTPGVPDIYQGTEVWDLSLVDPDNRRAVDYFRNAGVLASLKSRSAPELLRNWKDGAIKMAITQNLLGHRARYPQLFAEGDYVPVAVQGARDGEILAFKRTFRDQELLVVVPIANHGIPMPPEENWWTDTTVEVSGSGTWKNILLNNDVLSNSGHLPVGQLLIQWPVAVLARGREMTI